jgi:hypothetical protein
MKKTWILALACIFIIASSCKKDDDVTIMPEADYYQLKSGNYWVYREYDIDTNGVVSAIDKWDSAYIDKDTVIRGYKYYKLWERGFIFQPDQHASFLRDSSGYLISSSGYIMCSDNNFRDTLHVDTTNISLSHGFSKMIGKDSLINVPAGDFESITYRRTVIPSQPADPHPTRYCYNSYGKGVGRIKSHIFYYGSGLQVESRLVRYKVK